MKRSYANAMLLGVSILWGGGFIATSGALDAFSPFYIMMIRFVGASIFPLCLCYKKLKTLDRVSIMGGLFAGLLLFLAFAFQTYGLKYSTPSKNAFLTATNVIFVPYLLWIYMRRVPKKKEMFASLLCLVGIAFLTLNGFQMEFTLGDIFSVVCAFFFATHMIVLEKYAKHCDAMIMTTLQMLGAGIVSTICALCFEQPPTTFSWNAIGNILYLILVSTLLAYFIQTYAQRYTSANTTSLLLSTEALFASLFSFLILKEAISIPMMIGACLIFISVIYMEYKPKKNRKA